MLKLVKDAHIFFNSHFCLPMHHYPSCPARCFLVTGQSLPVLVSDPPCISPLFMGMKLSVFGICAIDLAHIQTSLKLWNLIKWLMPVIDVS